MGSQKTRKILLLISLLVLSELAGVSFGRRVAKLDVTALNGGSGSPPVKGYHFARQASSSASGRHLNDGYKHMHADVVSKRLVANMKLNMACDVMFFGSKHKRQFSRTQKSLTFPTDPDVEQAKHKTPRKVTGQHNAPDWLDLPPLLPSPIELLLPFSSPKILSTPMKNPTRRLLLLLACVLLVAEFTGFSHGRRIVAEEKEHPSSSVEEQRYRVPRTQQRRGSGSSARMYEASARPVAASPSTNGRRRAPVLRRRLPPSLQNASRVAGIIAGICGAEHGGEGQGRRGEQPMGEDD
ncbi:hypothetical protein EJB05_23842, partial [Eragrostis curvula]